MENLNIEGIGDLNKVTELFAQLNCPGSDNCIGVATNRDFGAVVDPGDSISGRVTSAGANVGGIAGGIIGAAVGNAINNTVREAAAEFNQKTDEKQKIAFSTKYAGFLINVTSEGVGVIPLRNGGQLMPNIKDCVTDAANFIFFSNDEIVKREMKNLLWLKVFHLYFANIQVGTPWQVPKKHKLVPYQAENFKKLEARL